LPPVTADTSLSITAQRSVGQNNKPSYTRSGWRRQDAEHRFKANHFFMGD
jgi:hypothetical protein